MAYITIRRSVVSAAVGLCLAGGLVWASKGCVGAFTIASDPWLDPSVPAPSDDAVVVAELFTSEGCSSCPPADEVLSRLVREPLGATVVLGLGEHVDYWDRLGWRDPFSSSAFSNRQSEYHDRVFRTRAIYTPELVVDGQFEAVGSDVSAVRRAIANAARVPKALIELAASPADAGHLSIHVQATLPSVVAIRERADVIVALTQDHLTNDVPRGENGGRRLAHSAVVRSLTALGTLKPPAQTFETTVTVPVESEWNLDDLKIIGLLQERGSRRIVGAGSARLTAHKDPPSR